MRWKYVILNNSCLIVYFFPSITIISPVLCWVLTTILEEHVISSSFYLQFVAAIEMLHLFFDDISDNKCKVGF